MKHLKKGRKLSREKKQREALVKILAGELFSRGKIMTTEAKAKELKIFAEKICNKIKDSLSGGKRKKTESLSALRRIRSYFPKNIESKLLFEISESLLQKRSGFVRIIKAGSRHSDGTRMALIEIIKKKEAKKQ